MAGIRIVHKNIDVPELLWQGLHETPDLIGLADIKLYRQDLDAVSDLLANLLRDLLERVDSARREHKLKILGGGTGELECRAPADAGGGSSYDNRLALRGVWQLRTTLYGLRTARVGAPRGVDSEARGGFVRVRDARRAVENIKRKSEDKSEGNLKPTDVVICDQWLQRCREMGADKKSTRKRQQLPSCPALPPITSLSYPTFRDSPTEYRDINSC